MDLVTLDMLTYQLENNLLDKQTYYELTKCEHVFTCNPHKEDLYQGDPTWEDLNDEENEVL